MKILFIIALFTISIVGYSQEKQDSIPKLTKEVIYNDVKDVLKSLGESLKVGSEHVYEVLVKQQIVNSVTNLVFYILSTIIVISLVKAGNKEYEKDRYSDGCTAYFVISGLIGVLSIVFLCVTLQETVMGFINPEYGAIEKIISLIKR